MHLVSVENLLCAILVSPVETMLTTHIISHFPVVTLENLKQANEIILIYFIWVLVFTVAQDQSLVREQRSHKPHSVAKQTNKKQWLSLKASSQNS